MLVFDIFPYNFLLCRYASYTPEELLGMLLNHCREFAQDYAGLCIKMGVMLSTKNAAADFYHATICFDFAGGVRSVYQGCDHHNSCLLQSSSEERNHTVSYASWWHEFLFIIRMPKCFIYIHDHLILHAPICARSEMATIVCST